MMRVADYIMQRLHLQKIEHIYMVSGRGALFLTDAIAAHKKLQAVCVHHEQSAAYAAVAHAQYTGNTAVCLVSTGCAGTNAVTGVLNAWQDAVPCLFISGQNKLNETSRYTGIPIRTFGQQEADIIPIVESITKYAVMITDPKQIVYELDKALYLAQHGRKGPVWIDVPLDVQNMRIEPNELDPFIADIPGLPLPDLSDVNYLAEQLYNSQRPALLIGSGVRAAEAIPELQAFLKNCPIPLTYAASAVDTYGSHHPLSIGSVGIMGCSRAANFTVQNSDLLIVMGCRLSSMTTGPEHCKFARQAKIVVIDIDQVEHSKQGIKIERLILADIKALLLALNQHNISTNHPQWLSTCQRWKKIFPVCEDGFKSEKKVDLYQLTDSLSNTLPDQATLLTDSGLIEVILPTNLRLKPTQRCLHPVSQGSMGFALPAIIGAYYASCNPIVAVIGDGSIMMNLQEFDTIKYHKIPAKIFVINNNAYAVIRKRQHDMFRSRTIGTDPSNGVSCPDFEKLAHAFDFRYQKIENSDELDKQLESIFMQPGPVLCEIMGLCEQDYISSGHARNLSGKIVSRPLEDQSPYLDRSVFLSEMIIEPIDQ